MDHNTIINTILALHASLISKKIAPNKSKKIKNGERFIWNLDHGVILQLDQFDVPEECHYEVRHPKFTLIIKEDSKAQKYFLDAPQLQDEEFLGSWLAKTWLECKDNLE